MKRRQWLAWLAAVAAWVPGEADAHSFSVPYILPVPFWLYLYAGAATLVVSLVVAGYFASAPQSLAPDLPAAGAADSAKAGRWPLILLRAGAVFLLAMCVLTGFFGTQDPENNLGMTLFWVVLLGVFLYATALAGDVYDLINPWRTLIGWIPRIAGRFEYPEALGYLPAFVLYLVLLWLELFLLPRPATLATALAIYTGLAAVGALSIGSGAWFRWVDPVGVILRIISTVSPFKWSVTRQGGMALRARPPFSAAMHRADHLSLALVILLMLSATTYDALLGTSFWQAIYWQDLLSLFPSAGSADPDRLMMGWEVFRRAGLILAPFVYFGAFVGAVWLGKAVTGSNLPLPALVRIFVYSLVPIAVVYNFAHYFTFVVTQVARLPAMISDPFGRGWNLLGVDPGPGILNLNMGVIWHVQVALIVAGHVASIAISHRLALSTFGTRQKAFQSQIPMLVLMIGYTMIGLWVLSLPLSLPRVLTD